eukprot:TRINITY_DN15595_c0_g1_i1.p1 TRINITY_DN15595_c0_g1~~TRINITY_DN15595_c0_g1_i1.p1  ORF type:complete len:200 (-),score=26.03 TRINITY_DN15595_c0_g1_i1:50-649(-)
MQQATDQTRAQKQSVPPAVKSYLSPSDPRVSSQPSLMPQVTRDSRLGSLPSDMQPGHLPLTPGQSMEEKYKMMERFCRQSWINHGMIGGGASVLASSAALWVAHKRNWFGRIEPSHVFITGAFAFAFGFFFRAERVMKDCYYLADLVMGEGVPHSSRQQRYSILGEPNEVERNPKQAVVNDLPNEAYARFSQAGKPHPN